tara:strand:+ start:1233 stop:1829 length:597 start_codon:yes stop_codon:yes gene_type:complete
LENIKINLTTISKIISTVINPFLASSITFAFLIYCNPEIKTPHTFFFISFLFSNILQLITIFFFVQSGKVSSIDAPIKEQRIELLAIGSIYYAIGFVLLSYFEAPQLIKGVMFCYAVNTAIVWRITIYWKISIHMIGIGGPFIALWLGGFTYPIIMGTIIILVAISRLVLKAHTPAQIICGLTLAMVLAYIELTYLFL